MNPQIEDLLDQDAKDREMEGRLWDLETSALEEEAADVIRRLKAENAILRDVLKEVAPYNYVVTRDGAIIDLKAL